MKAVALTKKQENIAEYLLYMWQMEDLLRAADLNTAKLEEYLETRLSEPDREWFETLAQTMKRERLEQSGHLSELHEILAEMQYLANLLQHTLKDKKYLELHALSEPILQEARETNPQRSIGDIQQALEILYGILLLRIQQRPVSTATKSAGETLAAILAYVSANYHKFKQGKVPGLN